MLFEDYDTDFMPAGFLLLPALIMVVMPAPELTRNWQLFLCIPNMSVDARTRSLSSACEQLSPSRAILQTLYFEEEHVKFVRYMARYTGS